MNFKTILRGALAPLLLFILLTSFSASAMTESDAKKIFPNVSQLEGGAELWLNTGIRTTKEDNFTVYSTTYSYYSGKEKKLMNIIRKGQYETNVALYSFNNFVDASMYFYELVKDAPENRRQQVRFGERGLFFLYPKSGYLNDADFYLVFLNKTFVVWMYANDGFALMDLSSPINEALEMYIADNPQMYLIKRLTLEILAKGFKRQTKQLEFTTDFPKSISVSGKVFTKSLDPLPVATVNILETGDSLFTDADGNFQHTINLEEGGQDVKLAENFYMEPTEESQEHKFKGGFFESGLKYNTNGKTITQLWKLETAGDKVFGTSYVQTSSGYKDYRLKGTMQDNKIELTLDCKRAGSDFGCEQRFTGEINEGVITGTWDGTGGGGIFSADDGGYRPVERKIILTDKTALSKTFSVSADGKLQKSAENMLNIGSARDSRAMIYIKPNRDHLRIDPVKNISAKLVLTHLPDQQSGQLSLFTYSLRHDGTSAYLNNSRFAGQVYVKEEPYVTSLDITDLLLEGDGSIMVGSAIETGSRGNHNFASALTRYETLKPYILVKEYSKSEKVTKVEKPFVMVNDPKKHDDFLGEKNSPFKDGKDDYCYDAAFAYPEKTLTGFELEITGKFKRRYNTNPLDIYPLVGFIKGDKLINNTRGELSYKFGSSSERFLICVSGSHIPEKTEKVYYRYFIDGRPYEGLLH